MKLISGTSNPPLAKNIAQLLNIELIDVEIDHFSNGEKKIWIKNQVQGENVIVVQSLSNPVDEHIMELLLIIDALERLGARHVNAVLPWYGYSLQDKVFRKGEPLSAKIVANLISSSYVKRNFLLDVHNTSITGFFSEPTHHITALTLFVDYINANFDLSKLVIASPDFGGLKRAWNLAEALGVDWVNIDKRRDLKTGKILHMELHGEVEGKIALVFDDVIVSGSTVVEATEVLRNNGAEEVHFLATHGLLVCNAMEKLEKSDTDSIVITNSIHHDELPAKVKVIDCSTLFAEQLTSWM